MQSNLEQFKRKMSNLIRTGKQTGAASLESPTNSANDDERSALAAYEANLLSQMREQAKGLPLNNPHKEREILESIDASYYQDWNFDPKLHELKKLPDVLEVNEIKREKDRKKNQLLVVSKKVSDLILHHHPSYSAELQKVTELQSTLSSAYATCRTARKMIDGAQENSTIAGLTILGTYRKRQRLVAVMEALKRLKTLQETDQRLRELFEEENYIGAIMMCAECQRAAASFRQYRCISDLAKKLQDTMLIIEEQLDTALAATAVRVDLERYSRVVAAYEMIQKTTTAANLLVSHFIKAINNAADTVIAKYRQNDVAAAGSETTELGGSGQLESVPPEQLVSCLRELLSICWRIWMGYHAILLWHMERPVLTSSGSDSDEHADAVETKLEQGLGQVWQESVRRLNLLLQSADIRVLKMDEFLTVIDLVNKISSVGRRHFRSESVDLEETLREKSLDYFKAHHRHSLDELAMFLEMEAWEAVPVKRSFTYKDLPEYAFLARASIVGEIHKNVQSQVIDLSGRLPSWDWMAESNNISNPFETNVDAGVKDSLNGFQGQVDSDDSDVPDELKQDFIDETAADRVTTFQRPLFKRHESYKPIDLMQPILSNAALSLLRLWGRYLQAAVSLPIVAFDVVVLLGQLFDYYFMAVHRYFGSDAFDLGVEFRSSRLVQAIQRIERSLMAVNKDIPPNRISESMLTYADRLFGLGPRIVAVESLVFVAHQLENLRPTLERIVSSNKIAFVQQFYSQMVGVTPDLRRCVYGAVASKALNYNHFVTSVASVNWEIGELMSQHSGYVDFLIQDLDNLRLRLSELARTTRIPKEAYVILWEFCVQIIVRLLVEGYSCARKCTNEGRALMQLDFQQLLMVMEKISNLRPLPHREYVENYIKAYYLPEASIEEWIMERKEYSTKQLVALLNVATHVSRKTRQRLIAQLQGHIDDG